MPRQKEYRFFGERAGHGPASGFWLPGEVFGRLAVDTSGGPFAFAAEHDAQEQRTLPGLVERFAEGVEVGVALAADLVVVAYVRAGSVLAPSSAYRSPRRARSTA